MDVREFVLSGVVVREGGGEVLEVAVAGEESEGGDSPGAPLHLLEKLKSFN